MGAAGSSHGTFQRALERGNLTVALATARELAGLTLEDALALTELLARVGDERFEAAAARWLGRLAAERRPRLRLLGLAAELLRELEQEQSRASAYAMLRALLRSG
ncbi:MAG TPA: hypothetical protein VFI37_05300 [Gaiellaceae bacterium]|nr:hypothetical protein [Gaiellaceae bacterium]